MRKIKNLIPGERVTIDGKPAEFRYINGEGQPVFDLLVEGHEINYVNKNLTESHYVWEIK